MLLRHRESNWWQLESLLSLPHAQLEKECSSGDTVPFAISESFHLHSARYKGCFSLFLSKFFCFSFNSFSTLVFRNSPGYTYFLQNPLYFKANCPLNRCMMSLTLYHEGSLSCIYIRLLPPNTRVFP